MINDKNIGQIAIETSEQLQIFSPISYKHIFQSIEA